jgi:hypothetical protein
MKELESLRRELDRLRAAIPKQDPWPPEDSFALCLYEKLGRPDARMDYFDMYSTVAEKVWCGEPTANMIDFAHVTEC